MLSAAIGNITYDARGNTVGAGSKTYGYDIFNQLTSAVGSGVNASMDYDPVGRLAEVTGSGVTTKFVYSGSQMIAETNSSGTTLRRYVHGPGTDEPIVWYEGSGTTDRRWLMSDNQGSITAITNSTGAVTAKNRYNEYGVPDTANTGRFQYTGQMWLAEADIYHYKARAYDPYLGRFLQTDPIGYAAGMNVYAYVGGDPVNYNDPTGLTHCPPGVDCVISTGTRKTRLRFAYTITWVGAFFSRGSNVNDRGFGGGGSGGSPIDEVIVTGVKRGHDYRTTNVICDDASLLSREDLQNTVAWFTIPRHFSSLVDARTVGNNLTLVRTSNLGIPGGFVTTRLLDGGLTGINTTVEGSHLLSGTVTRSLFTTPSNQLALSTVGIGRSDFRITIPNIGYISLGPIIDAINEPLGRSVFNAQDAQAADRLRRMFPGC